MILSQSVFAKGGKSDEFTVEGYVHPQFVADFHREAQPRYGFVLKRARVDFDYRFADIVRAEIEIAADELNLTVKEAYAEYRVGPWLGFAAGLKKMPFSREELIPLNRSLAIERSHMNSVFEDMGYLGRDIGLTVGGELGRNRLPLGYAFGIYNGNGLSAFQDIDDYKNLVVRLTVEPMRQLVLGFNVSGSTDAPTGRPRIALGGDIGWYRSGVTVETEVLTGTSQTNARVLGGYLTGAWRLGVVEPMIRLERLYYDLPQPANRYSAVNLGLNWYAHKRVQFKFGVVANNEPGQKTSFLARLQLQAGM